MSWLVLDGVAPADDPEAPPVDLALGPGQGAAIAYPVPDRLLSVLAGWAPARPGGSIRLDGVELARRPAHARAAAGLAVADRRLPDLPSLRVVDALLLGRPSRPRQPPGRTALAAALAAALGGARARAARADEEAGARAVGGRFGLGPWLDDEAVGLPPEVSALAEVVRALAGRPQVLVWLQPEGPSQAATQPIADAVAAERARRGLGTLRLRRS